MVADVGHFHNEGGVSLEMGRGGDWDFGWDPANRGVVTVRTTARVLDITCSKDWIWVVRMYVTKKDVHSSLNL